MDKIDRRTLLLGSAGLVLAGCGGGTKSPTSDGPNIVKPKTGNVVTAADTVKLRDQLNKALKSGDVKQMSKLINAEAYDIEDFEKRWTRRLANFERLGFVEGEWYVGTPNGRTRNAAGGLVEYSGDLVFAHTIAGCDGQQVVESSRAEFRKKSTDAPLELMRVGAVEEYFDPSFWDVADIDAIGTKHAWIAYRAQDAKRAKAFAKRIDAGTKKAFDLMPKPKGVDKIFFALTWPEVDGKLYGGIELGESDANEYYHPFLDPDQLARGQKKPADNKGLPLATGRVGLHQDSFARDDFNDIPCHEAIHVLADQWNASGDTPIWIIEGLAEWGCKGTRRLMAEEGGRIRSNFAAFQKAAPGGYDEFHHSGREYEFYQCAAAVYAYLDSTKGRGAALGTAKAFYGASNRDEGAKALGRSEKDLLTSTAKWLKA